MKDNLMLTIASLLSIPFVSHRAITSPRYQRIGAQQSGLHFYQFPG
jgi:hypothetical protein